VTGVVEPPHAELHAIAATTSEAISWRRSGKRLGIGVYL
jgi:hypothetical protein